MVGHQQVQPDPRGGRIGAQFINGLGRILAGGMEQIDAVLTIRLQRQLLENRDAQLADCLEAQ